MIQALEPADAVGPVQGILGPIVERLGAAVTMAQGQPEGAVPVLVQAMNSLTACFKGLSPSDDDMFEPEEDDAAKNAAIAIARGDAGMVALRQQTEQAISGVLGVWNGDGQVADVSGDGVC